MSRFLLLLFSFLGLYLNSQTIIMNEVSNGPSGNQEYVEFVVVSNSVTYNCNNSTPPCIDIRGWIFDDNSGYHGGTTGTGVAQGAVRFSQNSIWSCVPLGTIILLYNNADRNPAIPADDVSMSDGNCRIIAPISNTALFESNATTPGATSCSYPSTGWVAGGDWNNTVLANSGDCARIVNLAGCEVFSVCYGTANTNNLIYFTGNGGQKVFYFNDSNPALQANWSSGSASPSPGSQTPGAPNNAANAAYIGQFNNNCMPITPISIGSATVSNTGCTCTGSASVNASGSIGPYTYVWYDSNSLPIGQTSATATGLCAGAYKVVTTSHIGCKDSVVVNISSSPSVPTVTVNNQVICSGNTATLTATPSIAGGTYSWMPGGQTTSTISVSPSSTTSYSVTYTIGGCSTSTIATVTVNSTSTATISASTNSLCTSGQTATLTLLGSTGTYIWSNGATTGATTINSPGIYTATVTSGSCGSATASINITSVASPTISISASSNSLCLGSSVILTASSNTSNYQWPNGITTNTFNATSSPVIVTTTNNCGSAQATQTLNILTAPDITLSNNSFIICSGQSVTVTATSSVSANYVWSNGATTQSTSVNAPGVYTVTASNVCGNASETFTVNSSTTASVTAIASQTLLCSSQSATLSATGSTGSYIWSNGSTSATTTASNSGVYTVTLTNSCGQATSSITVTSLPTPTVSITSNVSLLCPGNSATLTASSNVNNYQWNTGSNFATIVINNVGVNTVTVSNACGTATSSINITVGAIPVLVLTASSTTICPNESATLTVTGGVPTSSGGSINYVWSNSSTTGSVTTTNGGVVTVSNSNACGASTASIMVTVNNLNASISANPISGTSPLTVSFTNNSSNATSYTWDFDNGNTANTQTVIPQTYYSSGFYTVYLTAMNGVCVDTDSLVIHVEEESPTLYVPNAFTPNGDSINDVFLVGATNIKEFNMIIFDRWGLKLFESNDILHGWDGKVNGKIVSDGTYFLMVEAKGTDNSELKKQGTVTLFK